MRFRPARLRFEKKDGGRHVARQSLPNKAVRHFRDGTDLADRQFVPEVLTERHAANTNRFRNRLTRNANSSHEGHAVALLTRRRERRSPALTFCVGHDLSAVFCVMLSHEQTHLRPAVI